ncbi:DUF3301 domain-containing protein [Halothiobacillus sp. DCM-1]|uniref:DUF3301 domain-containing protein n=1 Tax=Halothiobacillus sp. DCM-1 TaxID=3112558 RepID=UPI003254B87D
MIGNILILFILALIAYVWWQQDAFRRRAFGLAREGAARAGARLLDDSVELIRWRLRRVSGTWRVERIYGFEVTATGGERFAGRVMFLGQRVSAVDLDFAVPVVLS